MSFPIDSKKACNVEKRSSTSESTEAEKRFIKDLRSSIDAEDADKFSFTTKKAKSSPVKSERPRSTSPKQHWSRAKEETAEKRRSRSKYYTSAHVYISAVGDDGPFGEVAGCGVFWREGDHRNRSLPVEGRASENRANLLALSVALEEAKLAWSRNIVIHSTNLFLGYSLRQVIQQGKTNGWLSSENESINDLDLVKKLHTQLENNTVRFGLGRPSDPQMTEAEDLAICGLQVAKCLWAHAKIVHTSAMSRTSFKGPNVAVYGTCWEECDDESESVKPTIACLEGEGATIKRAQLKAISVAITQAINMDLDRVIIFVESVEIISALNLHISTWKSNNWMADSGKDVPAPENIDLLVEIDCKRERIQVAFQNTNSDDLSFSQLSEIIEEKLAKKTNQRTGERY